MFETQTVPFDRHDALSLAEEHLQKSEVIAAPTDTVYGIMANYSSPEAIKKIYAIKERPFSKAIPILIGETDQLGQIADIDRLAAQRPLMERLIEQWWPGALTLVLPAHAGLPHVLTSGQSTIAVRLPDHARLRDLLSQSGPLATTSANLSGASECIDAPSVYTQLAGRLPIIFDGGICSGGVSSTIVNLAGESGESPQILRAGPLASEIEALLRHRDY